LSTSTEENELTETILKIINEKNPQSVKELTTMIKESIDLDEETIIKSVLNLQAEGAIKLGNQALQPEVFKSNLKINAAIWYITTIAAAMMTIVLVFVISENVYPWFYVRNVFGGVFVLFLPGYALLEALFPVNMLAKTFMGTLDATERLVLSISLSISIVAIVGLLLLFSPWGLNLTDMILSLFVITLVFATVAVTRTYIIKREE
jgi:hypothetical protein